jgi:hypothetical protein
MRWQNDVIVPGAYLTIKKSQKLCRLFGKRRRANESRYKARKAALAQWIRVHYVDFVTTAQRVQSLPGR